MPIIILPKTSLIYMDDERIEIEIPDKYFKKINMENIENAKGILKNFDISPIEYQKKIRSEWA